MRARSFLIAVFLASCSSCGFVQTENSYAGDELIYGSLAQGRAEFVDFKFVLLDECSQCHSEFLGYSETQWQDLGLVVAGDSINSTLFRRIKGSNVGGDEDMPPSGSLDKDDVDTVKEWIDTL
jgi:uncharacterized membrane protein